MRCVCIVCGCSCVTKKRNVHSLRPSPSPYSPPPFPNLLYPPSLPPPRHNLCNVRLKVVAAPVSSSVDGVDDTGDGAEAAAVAVSSALGTSTST